MSKCTNAIIRRSMIVRRRRIIGSSSSTTTASLSSPAASSPVSLLKLSSSTNNDDGSMNLNMIVRSLSSSKTAATTTTADTINNNNNNNEGGKPQRRRRQRSKNRNKQLSSLSKNEQSKLLIRELVKDLQLLRQRLIMKQQQQQRDDDHGDDENHRHRLAALDVFHRIQMAERRNLLYPSNRHRYEMTKVAELILEILSGGYNCYFNYNNDDGGVIKKKRRRRSIFDECMGILDWMKRHKLQLQQVHCEYAILAATKEGKWKDAVRLFRNSIDPDETESDDTGYTPYNASSNKFPVGMYAIARSAQEDHRRSAGAGLRDGGDATTTAAVGVVENVMDGVRQMTMVSPTDQDKYVLAAGVAIGHAGEWQAFIDFMNNSYDVDQFGQHLAVAVMQACLICDQPDAALEVFDSKLGDHHEGFGEWQWGGGHTDYSLYPLCRDLAMRALGRTKRLGQSNRALDFFCQVEKDGVLMSVEALSGVVQACENDGDWRNAMNVLLPVFGNRDSISSWLVPANELMEESPPDTRSTKNNYDNPPQTHLPELGSVLVPVMRACNASGQFGLSLLCFRIFELAIPSTFLVPFQDIVEKHRSELRLSPISDSLITTIIAMSNVDELLSTVLVSLCGVECPDKAVELYEAVKHLLSVREECHLADVSLLQTSSDLHEFADLERVRQIPASLHTSWLTAHRNINRITAAYQSGDVVSAKDTRKLASALGATLSSCTDSQQAETGLYLARWMGVDYIGSNGSDSEFSTGTTIPMIDALLSAIMEASAVRGENDAALQMFTAHVNTKDDVSTWILSYNTALGCLFHQGRDDDATSLLQNVLAGNRNPDTFCVAARGFARSSEWDKVADLYRLALTSGCVSEELAILAMKAAVSTKVKNRIGVLRNIIAEVSKLVCMEPSVWTESKYWTLKRHLGLSNVQTLMWWDDPTTSHLEELDFALNVFDERREANLTSKNAVLRLIVAGASTLGDDDFPDNPDNETKLSRIPRDQDEWIRVLKQVLNEASEGSLIDDPYFVDDVAVAFQRFHCGAECVEFVSDALLRGVQVRQRALNAAKQAYRNSDVDYGVGDIRLFVEDAEQK